MKSKHKLTDKIRVLEHVEKISLNKKRLLVQIKKTLKDINRKKRALKIMIYQYYP